MFKYKNIMVHSRVSVSFLILRIFIAELLISPAACLLSPIIPPRFDNFCEQVVGTWGIPSNSQIQIIGDVEEVMRSCGGAVQGIREVPKNTSDKSTAMYHNRADDGFVYFDCGSYTQGPVRIKSDMDDQEMNGFHIVGSLSFSTLPKSRVIFDFTSESRTWQTLVRTIKNNTPEPAIDTETSLYSSEKSSVEGCCMKTIWEDDTVCCMASASQPWMLQRAKFLSLENEGKSSIQEKKRIDPNDLDLRGWIKTWDGGNEEMINQLVNESYRDGENKDFEELLRDTSKILEMGATCMNSGEVKSILRCYSMSGELKAIILQYGELCTESDETL